MNLLLINKVIYLLLLLLIVNCSPAGAQGSTTCHTGTSHFWHAGDPPYYKCDSDANCATCWYCDQNIGGWCQPKGNCDPTYRPCSGVTTTGTTTSTITGTSTTGQQCTCNISNCTCPNGCTVTTLSPPIKYPDSCLDESQWVNCKDNIEPVLVDGNVVGGKCKDNVLRKCCWYGCVCKGSINVSTSPCICNTLDINY